MRQICYLVCTFPKSDRGRGFPELNYTKHIGLEFLTEVVTKKTSVKAGGRQSST
jgi:hypothetical protein